MDAATIVTLIWLIAGVALLGSELFLPGLVAMFLGAAAVLVAGVRWIGLVDSLGASLIVWLASSAAMIVGLRGVVRRLLPAETSRGEIDEALQAYGAEVEVAKTISEGNMDGRIRYQGTTWPAMSSDGTIAAGRKARLLYRDKESIGWVVEPIPAQLKAGHTNSAGDGD